MCGLDKLECSCKLTMDMVRDGVRKFVYNADRPANLKDVMGLCVDGNWEIWVRGCGGETVSIYAIGEEAVGFSIVKIITLSTLELVNWVGRSAVSMVIG